MQQITALLINDDLKTLSSLRAYLLEQYKSITTIYTSDSLLQSEELIRTNKPDLILFNMSFVDYINNSYLCNYLNNIECEIVYTNTYKARISNIIGSDAKISLVNSGKKSNMLGSSNNYDSGIYGFDSLQIIELLELITKAVTMILEKKEVNFRSNDVEIKWSKIIAIPSMDSIDLIETVELLYLEADGNYTIFHLLNGDTIISSKNLGVYESQLDSNTFFRIHHKYFVNIKMVKSINKTGENYCKMVNGKELPIAKRRQLLLYRFLNLR